MEADNNVKVVVKGEVAEVDKMQDKNSEKSYLRIFVLVLVFGFIACGVAYEYLQIEKVKLNRISVVEEKEPVPTPTMEPLPLPQGPRTIKYSHGKNVLGPKPQEVKVSNLDPGKDGLQKLSVTITHDAEITEVSVNLKTDNKVTTHLLSRVGGTNLSGTWEGEWVLDDTYEKIYFIEFDIKSLTTFYKDGLYYR